MAPCGLWWLLVACGGSCVVLERTAKQDGTDHKPRSDTDTYAYAGGLNLLGLAIGGYLAPI